MEVKGRVSVVIALYNQKQYVAETIKSALSQTYHDVEVIVVDDGSTDDPDSVITQFPVKIFRQPNSGPSVARNKGIEHATGEFVVILDSDDLLDKDYILKTLPLMKEGVGAVTTDFARFGGDTARTSLRKPTLLGELVSNEMTCTALFRRSALLAIGGYKAEFIHGYEDWELWINLLKHGWSVDVLNETLFHYRIKHGYANSRVVRAVFVHKELVALVRRIHADLYQKYAQELKSRR